MQSAHPIRIRILGLQSSFLYPGFTEFPSLSRVYRVPVPIQGLQSSPLYIYLVSGKREGEEKHRETPSFQYYSFLFFQVGCTAMPLHTGFCSATRNWRELYKNLTVLSSLDAYTSIKKINVFQTSSDTLTRLVIKEYI